ncbi:MULTISPECIES: Fis family transcriptional regulator [unclassified Actinomyces]|uniref:Fis family transcriptional regulator n=1 Tax=unclassified Actinomyces TaxID=2609248 RepID=UPI002017C059|nr:MULTISPECIES: Fis family transcriptional regulator [unclassified Actinomyces]MCL3778643.1 Fis family transcriptional regulator [Actinomyces sp. AC-20-1]MCL3790566.1 Fis family transcriptional regulator [Actinomyces sp. 187325]MCL3792889.1 Fis family transcriptional regulator [Actinomyces sp. 186855]MCL3795283.1 Fis family transcriptional regulator [Actinomyces sp. 217892]
MEWDSLLEDLENRFDTERRAGIAAESADLAEAETASVRLVDRLRAAVGRQVHLRTTGGHRVDGRLMSVMEDSVVVDEGEALQALVPVARLAVVHPLPGPAPSHGSRRAGLAAALRSLARQGARVRLLLGVTEVVGRLVRVAADHVDVVTDAEPAGAQRVSVALSAVEAVRSR